MTELANTVIDIEPMVSGAGDAAGVSEQIGRACREHGFFYVTGHGVSIDLQRRLEEMSRRFFAQNLAVKMEIRMERGGRAWRGYFPVGGELTSGRPDLKEGIYFGAELPDDHPLVRKGIPLHGPNLFPASLPELKDTVLEYMAAMTDLGHAIMAAVALSLGLNRSYFAERYTSDPLILFRIFNYPRRSDDVGTQPRWGVGEHTDYGLLTILKQDDTGGLEVKTRGDWIAAPPIAGALLCNIGDMLERMTGGRYRSTPHRVMNVGSRDRLSFPFFFDPNFHAEVRPIEWPDAADVAADRRERWDGASVHDFTGTYGDYVLSKVSKVFPHLVRPH